MANLILLHFYPPKFQSGRWFWVMAYNLRLGIGMGLKICIHMPNGIWWKVIKFQPNGYRKKKLSKKNQERGHYVPPKAGRVKRLGYAIKCFVRNFRRLITSMPLFLRVRYFTPVISKDWSLCVLKIWCLYYRSNKISFFHLLASSILNWKK